RRGAILPPHVPSRVRGARRPASGRLRRAGPRLIRRPARSRPPVSPGIAKRTVALAGVALLVALVTLALRSPRRHHDEHALPQPVSTWYTALAAPYNPARRRTRTACGQRLDA